MHLNLRAASQTAKVHRDERSVQSTPPLTCARRDLRSNPEVLDTSRPLRRLALRGSPIAGAHRFQTMSQVPLVPSLVVFAFRRGEPQFASSGQMKVVEVHVDGHRLLGLHVQSVGLVPPSSCLSATAKKSFWACTTNARKLRPSASERLSNVFWTTAKPGAFTFHTAWAWAQPQIAIKTPASDTPATECQNPSIPR